MTVYTLSYSSTNVPTSSYVTLAVSTAYAVSHIAISDTSGELVKLAIGPVGSEVDLCTCPISGTIVVPSYIVAGQRLSLRAINANATTGYNVVSLLNA